MAASYELKLKFRDSWTVVKDLATADFFQERLKISYNYITEKLMQIKIENAWKSHQVFSWKDLT